MIATRLAAMVLLTDAPLFDDGQELAFSAAVWGGLAWSVSRFWNVDWVRRELIVFGAGAVVVLAAMSLGRRDNYRDDETFTSQWARMNPEAWRGYARRAEAWELAGRLEVADREVKRGLMLQPYAPELMQRQGSIQEKAGRLEEALLTFQEMAERNPTNWIPREKVADLTFKLGRFRAASDHYQILSDALPENEKLKVKLEAARKAELGHSP
jgi:tetratricopeptide (TPR) repeat protein